MRFASFADCALGLREQCGKSGTGGNGKMSFMAALAAALALAVVECCSCDRSDFVTFTTFGLMLKCDLPKDKPFGGNVKVRGQEESG